MYAIFVNCQKNIMKVTTLLNGVKWEKQHMITCKYCAKIVIEKKMI
jgi:hypothetical protein